MKHSFPYTGLMRCGECGAMVTAEEKHQLICSVCRFKFAYHNRDACPRCKTPLEGMRTPTILRYTYYHCTKRKALPCGQPAIRLEQLEAQIDARCAQLNLSERGYRWALASMEEIRSQKEGDRARVSAAQKKAYDNCLRRIHNLIALKTSADNADGSLLSDEEYAMQRAALVKEKAQLAAMVGRDPVAHALKQVNNTLLFVRRLRERAAHGSPETRRAILASVGSNLTLTAKNLCVSTHRPFRLVETTLAPTDANSGRFEPKKCGSTKGRTAAGAAVNPIGCSQWYDVRTYKTNIRDLVKKLMDFFLEHPDHAVPAPEKPEAEAA